MIRDIGPDFSQTSFRYSWISFPYREEENAELFTRYLMRNCVWKLECFGSNFPWDSPIPPVDKWEEEVADLNQHLIMISSRL